MDENVRMAIAPPAAASHHSLPSYSLAPRRSRILVILVILAEHDPVLDAAHGHGHVAEVVGHVFFEKK